MLRYGDPVRLVRHGEFTHHYYSRVYDPDAQVRTWKSTGCRSLKLAKEWVDARRSEAVMGKAQGAAVKAQTITFQEACEAWLEEKKASVSAAHYTTLASAATTFWIPHLGRLRLGDIRAKEVSDFLSKRKAGTLRRPARPLSAISVNQERTNFGTFFNWCRRQGLLVASPMEGVLRFSGEARRRTRYITREEEQRLLDACRGTRIVDVKARRNVGGRRGKKVSRKPAEFPQTFRAPDYMYPLVLMALRCGLRRGTLVGLRWRHILFRARQIEIEAELMKSGEDFSAPLPPSVIDALQAYRAELTRKWEEDGKDPSDRVGPDAKVFGVGDKTRILKPFRAICRAAELALTFHDLRRIFLNRCREAGVSIETAMRLSDHRTFETVRKHYREVRHAELVDAVRAVDGVPPAPPTAADATQGGRVDSGAVVQPAAARPDPADASDGPGAPDAHEAPNEPSPAVSM